MGAFSSPALRSAPIGAMLATMPPEPRPIDVLRFIAERPAGQPISGADIPGLEAAGGSACIEWLAHCGLIEASVTASGCIVRGVTEAGRAILAKAGPSRPEAHGLH